MLKKNNINKEILKYFIIFSLIILFLLWILQILLFKSFYKYQKISDIKTSSKLIKNSINTNNYEKVLNKIAFDNSVCIEMNNNNYDLLYSSTYFGKGCISSLEKSYRYKYDFISKQKQEETYELINEEFNNTTLVQALKLNNKYIFINTSLEPIDGITPLIQKQLIVITILIYIISIVLAYYISNHISEPIKDINSKAKNLTKGNYNITFNEDTNIKELEELSKTLNETTKELSRTDELRRDLMANVSHDLKTPLTMIKAYAEMSTDLHKDNLEKQKEDMNIIIEETDRLTLLVNDILELSKMETINEELEINEFDLIKMINNILDKYKVLEETESYNFIFIHKDKKLLIEANENKLYQVIYNLINNAINYTGEDNTVTIKVTNKDKIKVEIIDTGKGIKEEDIPYIWDKYYKNKKKHKRNLIGTGLGLSIVKKILEEHNYNYGVKSSSKGTNFYFEIDK